MSQVRQHVRTLSFTLMSIIIYWFHRRSTLCEWPDPKLISLLLKWQFFEINKQHVNLLSGLHVKMMPLLDCQWTAEVLNKQVSLLILNRARWTSQRQKHTWNWSSKARPLEFHSWFNIRNLQNFINGKEFLDYMSSTWSGMKANSS